MRAVTSSHKCEVMRAVGTPRMFVVRHLFKCSRRSPRRCITEGSYDLVDVDGGRILQLTGRCRVFRVGLLGLVSARTREDGHHLFEMPPGALDSDVVQFFRGRYLHPTNRGGFRVGVSHLTRRLGIGQLGMSITLGRLRARKLVRLRHNEVDVPTLRGLVGEWRSLRGLVGEWRMGLYGVVVPRGVAGPEEREVLSSYPVTPRVVRSLSATSDSIVAGELS